MKYLYYFILLYVCLICSVIQCLAQSPAGGAAPAVERLDQVRYRLLQGIVNTGDEIVYEKKIDETAKPTSSSKVNSEFNVTSRKFIVDSIVGRTFNGITLDPSGYYTSAYTYYDNGSLWKFHELDSNKVTTYEHFRKRTYNADSSFVTILRLTTPFNVIESFTPPPYDSFTTTENIVPRNEGKITTYNLKYVYVDSTNSNSNYSYVRYDSVVVVNDTLISRNFSLDAETGDVVKEMYYIKSLDNENGDLLFYDGVYYGNDTISERTTYQYKYDGKQLVERSIVDFSGPNRSSRPELIDDVYNYPRDNYRVNRRTTTPSVKEGVSYVETHIDNYDNLGSIIQTRTFSGSDTTASPIEVIDREFVGDRGERALIYLSIQGYSEEVRGLRPELIQEVFGRFEEAPVATNDLAEATVGLCRTIVDANGIRVEVPRGGHLTLVDPMGRITWTASVPGASGGGTDMVTVSAPLPTQGTGLHVLSGRGPDWRCATKVLR